MAALTRVTDVEHLGGRVLRVVFSDGLVRELDFEGQLGGFLASIDDDVEFAAASVDREAGTLYWGAGIDLDPDVLHGDAAAASAVHPTLVREYRLQQTG